MVPYILAIDAGTTSSRAIVFDKDTKKIGLLSERKSSNGFSESYEFDDFLRTFHD